MTTYTEEACPDKDDCPDPMHRHSETQLTVDELKENMCDQYPDCGLTQWSCNRLQDIVYSEDVGERRDLAVQIRKDMGELLQQALTSLKSEMVESEHNTDCSGQNTTDACECGANSYNYAISECQRVIDSLTRS